MKDKTGLLKAGAYYHVYNRANGSEKLFLSDENYRYFLRRYQNFITPIAHTYCYCLMPNHFHFLIEVKEEEELEAYFLENARVILRAKSFQILKLCTYLLQSLKLWRRYRF